ncbi:MAG TPA: hypothetical protein DD658_07140 [Deltaproteobacteria bacterium]|nr:MAG: hypothetical protein A2X88_08650 [Deltaproteobacteria bacterium GWC2_65_14]HBO69906.1 hypothetical protein [Deltaproteobacteria bacterium]
MARRLSIATKFFLTYFVITGTALAFAGIAGYLQFQRYAAEEVDQSLENQARLAAGMFRPLLERAPADRGRIAAEADRVGRELDTRLTVVLPGGEVAADSEVGAAKVPRMENHAAHTEVRDALSGKTGFSTRRSITLGTEQRYCAVPLFSGEKVVGVVRASLPIAHLNRRLSRVRTITWGTGFAAFLLMLIGTAIRARRVTGPLEEMRGAARDLAAGNLRRRVHVRTGDELEEMAFALNRTASRLEGTIHQLDRERSRLSALIENLSEGVIVVSGDRTVRMMNREAARLLGVAAPRDSQPYPEVIRHPRVLGFIDGWRDGKALPPAEVPVRHPSGERILRLAATAVPLPDERKGADLLLTLRDTTEEKRLSRIKSDFVSNASHELRTPLTNIRGYLEALQDALKENAPVDPSFIEIAHGNALRMERLIEDLLELSRAESPRAPAEKEEIRLPDFLERVASLHRPMAGNRGQTLTVEGEEGTIRADLGNLAVAMSNLVDNAVKYGREGGKIRVAGRRDNEIVVLEVEDDGPGIPPEHIPRIFERFYRVDKGRSRDLGGTGLGLSIAKHIVESQGGTIEAASRLGTGSRFTIRIPGQFLPPVPRGNPEGQPDDSPCTTDAPDSFGR